MFQNWVPAVARQGVPEPAKVGSASQCWLQDRSRSRVNAWQVVQWWPATRFSFRDQLAQLHWHPLDILLSSGVRNSDRLSSCWHILCCRSFDPCSSGISWSRWCAGMWSAGADLSEPGSTRTKEILIRISGVIINIDWRKRPCCNKWHS